MNAFLKTGNCVVSCLVQYFPVIILGPFLPEIYILDILIRKTQFFLALVRDKRFIYIPRPMIAKDLKTNSDKYVYS